MDDGLFDALPDSLAGGLAFAAVVVVLALLWIVVRRTRERHLEDLERRQDEWRPPPEPDDPRELPPRS